jgi:hypothetical protein
MKYEHEGGHCKAWRSRKCQARSSPQLSLVPYLGNYPDIFRREFLLHERNTSVIDEDVQLGIFFVDLMKNEYDGHAARVLSPSLM